MTDALAEAAARLYAAPPEEFVTLRAQEVARARKARDTALAAAVGKLRKPTVAAWLVNLLAHERPDLVDELLELGDELRTAQRELRGSDLRELSGRRRAVIGALAREAAQLAGPGRGNLPLTEVEGTLAAALSDHDTAALVRAGTLTKALEYTGFGESPRPQLRLVKDTPIVGAVTEKRSSPSEQERERRAEARLREEERRREEEEHARVANQARRELVTALEQLTSAVNDRTAAQRALSAAEKAVVAAEKRVKIAQNALADLS